MDRIISMSPVGCNELLEVVRLAGYRTAWEWEQGGTGQIGRSRGASKNRVSRKRSARVRVSTLGEGIGVWIGDDVKKRKISERGAAEVYLDTPAIILGERKH